MFRKLAVVCAILSLSLGVAQAQDGGEDHSPMHPSVVLGPPEGFQPPADTPPPPMPGDPEEAKHVMLETFFRFMDADGSGAIELEEFHAWVRDFRMPSHDGHMGDHPMGDDDMGDDHSDMTDGILRAGEGDLADLNIAPECSDELQSSEQMPQAEGVPCGDREGNLLFRTICNMPGYETVAISLPDSRDAACFGLEALRGEIGFEIVREDDGTVAFSTAWGKEAYKNLVISGPAVYQIRSTGGTTDGSVTLKFIDAPMGEM
jgi:hypothetical protein